MLDVAFPIYFTVLIFSMLLTALFEKKMIPALRKKAAQPIYESGPSWHLKKSGTPTMGGLGFLFAVITATLLAVPIIITLNVGIDYYSIMIPLLYALLNALVGVFDDLKKLRKKRNAGLSPIQKLTLQAIIAVLFLIARRLILGDDTAVSFAFFDLELGVFYYPISVFLLLGIVNCANLTDGIDGLAGSVAFSISISLFYISTALLSDVALISSALIGSALGFLIFNVNPAKIFMGDTGSLFFGAVISALCFSLDNPFLLLLFGIVYIIEGISVIIQVLFFKATGRRFFKMAPIHHHLEKLGWSENRICIAAMLLTLVCSLPAYVVYLP